MVPSEISVFRCREGMFLRGIEKAKSDARICSVPPAGPFRDGRADGVQKGVHHCCFRSALDIPQGAE